MSAGSAQAIAAILTQALEDEEPSESTADAQGLYLPLDIPESKDSSESSLFIEDESNPVDLDGTQADPDTEFPEWLGAMEPTSSDVKTNDEDSDGKSSPPSPDSSPMNPAPSPDSEELLQFQQMEDLLQPRRAESPSDSNSEQAQAALLALIRKGWSGHTAVDSDLRTGDRTAADLELDCLKSGDFDGNPRLEDAELELVDLFQTL